jgi:hypothetical protein
MNGPPSLLFNSARGSETPLFSECLDESNVTRDHCDSSLVVRHGMCSSGEGLGRQINERRNVVQRLVRNVPLMGRGHRQTGRDMLSP